MGYCPFSVLGRDIAGGVATGMAWRTHDRSVCDHGRVAARAATRTHDTDAKHAIWFFLGPRL